MEAVVIFVFPIQAATDAFVLTVSICSRTIDSLVKEVIVR